MYRELVSTMWTMVNLTIVFSLLWFLIENRRDLGQKAGSAAAAIVLFSSGLLSSQTYMLLTGSDESKSLFSPTIWWPLAVLAVVGGLGGGAWLSWLFRPRRIPVYLWVAAIAAFAVAVFLLRSQVN